jgi:hypothetical protein
MKTLYKLHNEWTDGTFEGTPFAFVETKREAVKIARRCAKALDVRSQVAAVLVCNAEQTVVRFAAQTAERRDYR